MVAWEGYTRVAFRLQNMHDNNAQQSVHLTLGILRTSQAVSHALSFFWLDGFAVHAPAQVTQTVGRLHIMMLYIGQL